MSIRQSFGQSFRQMTRRAFLKAATLATTAAGLVATSTDEGCGSDNTIAICDPTGTGYGYGYGTRGYGYGYGYHYGYGSYGYGCYVNNLSPQPESDLVLDRAAEYLASLSRRQWPIGKGARLKVRIG